MRINNKIIYETLNCLIYVLSSSKFTVLKDFVELRGRYTALDSGEKHILRELSLWEQYPS